MVRDGKTRGTMSCGISLKNPGTSVRLRLITMGRDGVSITKKTKDPHVIIMGCVSIKALKRGNIT